MQAVKIETHSKIVFIGAGNLATHLSQAFLKAGYGISQVYSRTNSSAQQLARILNSRYTSRIEEVERDADIYVIALSDKAIVPIINELQLKSGILLHTAGSISMDVLKSYTPHYGVFYPLQTFSKERDVDFSQIPICVEASDSSLLDALLYMGRRMSEKVYEINSEQRKQLHLSAVFVCNFTNHMYSIGYELLKNKGLDFDLLRPLILETAFKVKEMEPMRAQTGPAIRFDKQIIKKQEAQLQYYPMFQKLYRFVSDSICRLHSARENEDK